MIIIFIPLLLLPLPLSLPLVFLTSLETHLLNFRGLIVQGASTTFWTFYIPTSLHTTIQKPPSNPSTPTFVLHKKV